MINKLFDPITGAELVLYTSRGESDEVWRASVVGAVTCIAREYNIDEKEAVRRLENSDIENPITYRDEIFWVE